MATIEWGTNKLEASERNSTNEAESLLSEEYVVKALPNILSKFDMTAIFLMIVFFITNVPTAVAGGPAAFTYLLLGGVTFFIPCVIATAQLGVMFPHEGSLYNWTHKALGGYWSFFVAFCAWFPGVLVMITAGDVIVGFLNGLNANWFTAAWQQGAGIIAVIVVSGILGVQRFRGLQNAINVAVIINFIGVFLIAFAGIAWLLLSKPVATDFHLPNWGVYFSGGAQNIYLFGLVTLAYLGIETPLNMGGELAPSKLGESKKRGIITGHLFWGTILVLIGYLVATFAVLVVKGQSAGSASIFSLVGTVQQALGPIAGDVAAICLMCFFVFAAVTYNIAYARLLLVAGIDQRLPVFVGKLNRNRVPSNAIIFQTVVAAGITALIYFVVPYLVKFGSPENLSTQIYNVMLASSTLVWAFSTLFLFINLVRFYRRDPKTFRLQRIFPLPVIWGSVVLGSLSCLAAIICTFFFSWTALIPNSQWWYIIGGLTLICLIVAAVGSMLASSEAAWQGLNKDE